MKRPIASFAKAARAFWQDTDGVILPYVTLLLVVFVGVSVLAIDGTRAVSLQTQLQKGADALAIAGAAELNQQSDAIDRAKFAIDNLMTTAGRNKTLPGMGEQNVEDLQIRFMASLPASDADPITAVLCTYPTCTAENAEDAVYIEVSVQPVTLLNILPASFFGGTNSLTTRASAVAGRSDEVICGIPPVFMCNPYETAGMTDKQATDAMKTAMANPVEKRRQWRLKADKTGPGQFGWLRPPDGCNSADCLRDWIAQTNPNACFKKSSVSLNTGVMASAKHGFNVRFDIYHAPLKYSPSTAPGINVRKGYEATGPGVKGDWCKAEPGSPYYGDAEVMGLPKDKEPWESEFKGSADWDCAAYWTRNHIVAGVEQPKPAACTSSATMSRYEIYRYEIDNDRVGDWSGNGEQKLSNADTGTGESGRPYCAGQNNGVDTTTGTGPQHQDRRNISVALINCLAQGPFPPGANATDVPVAAFGDFFVTQPMGADPDHTEAVYGEFSKILTFDDGATIYGIVQLYR